MWWGSEEGESCGKAVSCALEEEEGVVEGEVFVAKNIKCQWEAWKWPLRGSSFGSTCMPPTSQKH